MKIIARNLPRALTEAQLKALFDEFGLVFMTAGINFNAINSGSNIFNIDSVADFALILDDISHHVN